MKIVSIPLKFVSAYAVVEGEKALLVDTGVPGCEDVIVQALKREGVGAKDISLIVITHAHADHTGSAERLRKMSGAPIGMQRADAHFVESGANAPVVPATFVGRAMALFSEKMNAKMQVQFKPDIIFEGPASLTDYGLAARVICTPGHTPGSLSVITDDGDAIVGDIVARKFMVGGKTSFPIFATDKRQVIESLKAILAEKPLRCFTAHAGEVKVEEIRDLVEKFESEQ
jgi:glyoxylase-like metal-dependent hydrolase (beta-lactamase superfamily II)